MDSYITLALAKYQSDLHTFISFKQDNCNCTHKIKEYTDEFNIWFKTKYPEQFNLIKERI